MCELTRKTLSSRRHNFLLSLSFSKLKTKREKFMQRRVGKCASGNRTDKRERSLKDTHTHTPALSLSLSCTHSEEKGHTWMAGTSGLVIAAPMLMPPSGRAKWKCVNYWLVSPDTHTAERSWGRGCVPPDCYAFFGWVLSRLAAYKNMLALGIGPVGSDPVTSRIMKALCVDF